MFPKIVYAFLADPHRKPTRVYFMFIFFLQNTYFCNRHFDWLHQVQNRHRKIRFHLLSVRRGDADRNPWPTKMHCI